MKREIDREIETDRDVERETGRCLSDKKSKKQICSVYRIVCTWIRRAT
mgnify:CR=1 FL=1